MDKEECLRLFKSNRSLINYFDDETIYYILSEEGYKYLSYLRNPSDSLIDILIKRSTTSVKYIDGINENEELKIKAIQANPFSIKYMKNVSEELKEMAVRRNPKIIRDLKNPSEKLKDLSLELRPSTIQYIGETSEKNQLEIIKKDHSLFFYIENPTEKAQHLAMDIEFDNYYRIKNKYHSIDLRYIKEIDMDELFSIKNTDPIKGIDYYEVEESINEDFRKLKFIENIDKDLQFKLLDKFGNDIVKYLNNPDDEIIIQVFNNGFISIESIPHFDIIYFLKNNIDKLDITSLKEILGSPFIYDELLDLIGDNKYVKAEIIKRKLYKDREL